MSKSNPLERAFTLLDIVVSSGRNLSLNEIVQISNLPQSSTFRLLSNLVESRMLSFDSGNKTYSAGPRVERLGLFVTGQSSLKDVCKPALDHLAESTNETSFFVTASQHGNTLLDYTVPKTGANTYIHPGTEFPLHATAAGKVIHAFSTDAPHALPASYALTAYRTETQTDLKALQDLFVEIHRQGYAINDGELDQDVYSICVPVFLRNTLAGALGVVGPKSRMLRNGLISSPDLANSLRQAADEISVLFK